MSGNGRVLDRIGNDNVQLFDNKINSLPVILTLQQVADVFQVSIHTIYQWSSIGRFDNCKFKVGKVVRVHRDKMFQ